MMPTSPRRTGRRRRRTAVGLAAAVLALPMLPLLLAPALTAEQAPPAIVVPVAPGAAAGNPVVPERSLPAQGALPDRGPSQSLL